MSKPFAVIYQSVHGNWVAYSNEVETIRLGTYESVEQAQACNPDSVTLDEDGEALKVLSPKE